MITRLTFNALDQQEPITSAAVSQAPSKTLERLEQMTSSNAFQRKLEEIEESGATSYDKIKILTEPIDLSGFEELDAAEKKDNVSADDFVLDGVEELF